MGESTWESVCLGAHIHVNVGVLNDVGRVGANLHVNLGVCE